MIVIPATPIFLSKGAIVPTEKELNTMIHVMVLERDMVHRSDGNRYGHMTIEELDAVIAKLKEYQKTRGA